MLEWQHPQHVRRTLLVKVKQKIHDACHENKYANIKSGYICKICIQNITVLS